jgi:hypothetical protein
MKKCKEFYFNKNNTWTIIYKDETISIVEQLPIEFDYIGFSEYLCFVHCSEYIQSCRWSFVNDGELCPFSKYFRWGFINSLFQIVVEPIFDFESGVDTQYVVDGVLIPDSKTYGLHWENGKCDVLQNGEKKSIIEADFLKSNNKNYITDIQNISNLTINDIINVSSYYVPDPYKSRPWTHPELNHGLDLLASDDALNCYMSAYGEMHVSKCKAAMMNFPYDDIKGSIEIVDWGCGQGIGSATIIGILKQRGLLQWVKRVTLIEPSQNALQRAVCNLSTITQNSVSVDAVNKFLPSNGGLSENALTSIGYKYSNVIHVFSNILDVVEIDLAAVARMVASSHGKHYVLCIGPKNGAAYRIEQFCSVFGKQNYFSHIDSACFGHITKTGHPYTCMTRCFSYDGSSLDYSRMSMYKASGIKICGEYDLELQIQNKVFSPQKANVAFRLQNIMAVDDIMYIDSVVNEVKVDFIIVRPNKGILLVNIFEKNLENYQLTEDKKEIITNNNADGIDEVYHSPIEHIGLCQASIKDGIEELLMRTIEDNRNFGLIKKVVIFTENNINQVKCFFDIHNEHINYTYLFGNEFITDHSISLGLFRKIQFKYDSPDFDDAVKRKLAAIISPSWHSYQDGRVGIEPKGVQKRLVVSHNTQQKISGVAGSGKTFVLAVRAINAMKRTGGNVLILTYNITLVNYLKYRLSEIREDFSWEKVDIYNYHQFFKIRASECQLLVKLGSYDDVDFFAKATKQKRYSAIFVDEVQDFTTEWLRIIMQNFLEPDGEFVVFGDPKQNVFQRPLDSNNDIRLGVIGGEWNKQLNTGRRFTNPRLATLAMDFQKTFFENISSDIINTEVRNNTFNFKIVNYIDMRANNSIEDIVSKVIEIIREDNDAQKFVVLGSTLNLLRSIDLSYRNKTGEETEVTFVSTERYKKLLEIHHIVDENKTNWKFRRDYDSLDRTRKQQFTTDKRCLKLSTIQSFKGWESPSVILILRDNYISRETGFMPMSKENIYTAITRARENLYVINISNNYYDSFFKNQSR